MTKPNETQLALVSEIMLYESGNMSEDETLALFQKLVDTGMAWQLQGSYGRAAAEFIRLGLIHEAKA